MSKALVPTPQEATSALERARLKAAIHLDVLSEQLARKALDPSASIKTILDTVEFNYKLSGLAAKQTTPAAPAGVKISFAFNAAKPTAPVTIEAEPVLPDAPSPAASLLFADIGDDLKCEIVDE